MVIKCKDSSTFTADHVVFTASLGVLKDRHDILFSPKLPSKKISAIENFGFGTVGTIYLEFPKSFWPNNTFIGYAFLWEDQHIAEAKSSNREWLLGIARFDMVYSFPNLLEGTVAGEYMREFENLSDQKIIDDCMWLLKKFLGKSLPQPTRMFRSKWLTNNNFLGTGSYFSVNSQKFNVTPHDLAEPIKWKSGKPIILFAGEATAEENTGTVHGAISSGWRAANEIAKYYKKNNL